MGRSIDAADTYATVYHTGLSLTRKKVGRGKRAVSYSGLRLAEGFEACRAPNRSGLRSDCPCRWPPSAARRSPPLLGVSSRGPRQSDIGRTPPSLGPSARRERRVGGRGHPARPHFGDPARDLQKSSQPPDSRAPQHPPISADRGPAAVGATQRHFSQCDLDAS